MASCVLVHSQLSIPDAKFQSNFAVKEQVIRDNGLISVMERDYCRIVGTRQRGLALRL